MDRIREIKGKKVMRRAWKDQREQLEMKKKAAEQKVKQDIRREKDREKKHKNHLICLHKVYFQGV